MSDVAPREEPSRLEVRAVTPDDLAFVFSTWLRCYRYSSRAMKRLQPSIYFPCHHLVIERLFERGARVYIAHPSGAPETILGYVCHERLPAGSKLAGVAVPEHIVHFVYVKEPFRRNGVARALLDHLGLDFARDTAAFTHLTDDAEAIWLRFPRLQYWLHLMA